MPTYEIDPRYVARLERDLTYMDTLAQAQDAAFAASRSYQDGLAVLHILQAQCRTYASACAELLAIWQAGDGAPSQAFEAGRLYGELVATLRQEREG